MHCHRLCVLKTQDMVNFCYHLLTLYLAGMAWTVPAWFLHYMTHAGPGLGNGNARHRQRLSKSRHVRIEAPLTFKGIDNTPALITVTTTGVLVRSGVLA